MREIQKILILIPMLMVLSCSDPNAFTQLSNKNSDEAIYQEALKKIDALQWDSAIDLIQNQMSATYKQRVDVRESLMGAYAGKCGLTFVELVNGLSNSSGGIFKIALGAFGGIKVDTSACDSAVSVLASLGTSTQRTQNQNLYAALLGLTKLGVNLHKSMDRESSGVGDGAVDAGWDICQKPVTSTAGQLTDLEVKKVIASVGLIFENIATLVAAIGSGNSGVGALDSAKTECEKVAGGPGSCTITDESSSAINAGTVFVFRKMIASSVLGLGSCDITVLPGGANECCPGMVP